MGLIKSAAVKEKKIEGPPWFMASGVYTATLVKVEVVLPGPGSIGPKPTYSLTFLPDSELVKPPSGPLDIPKVKIDLDCNVEEELAVLYGVIGKPMRDGHEVKWGSEGLIQWNGRTDDKFRAGGKVEITVDTEEPKPKKDRPGEYWWAKYSVEDISAVGDDERKTAAAADALIDCAETPKDAQPTPPGPTAGKGKGK